MNWLNNIAILVAAFLIVFVESTWRWPRNLLGVQVDLLPALVVYTSLSAGITTLALLTTLGGLWFDSLSANPLGISVLPLFVIGMTIHHWRELILREQVYAQFLLGLAASAATPVFSVLSLLGVGMEPMLGWWSIWQWLVMAVAGAACTPICFYLFGRFNRAFSYQPLPESSFRADREIKRGRVPHADI